MNQLHILTATNGKHLLIGTRVDAIMMARSYGHYPDILDSETLKDTHYVSTQWLVENNIKKVIQI
jgi:hypothetical protein